MTGALDAFRREVRTFLQASLPPALETRAKCGLSWIVIEG